jgi:hypothetical protein
VLFDTNVVLDLLLDREPFLLEAAKCFSRVEAGESISLFLSLFEITPVNKTALEGALNLPFKDFEDAALHEAARLVNADVIVIRNTSDFKHSIIPVRQPRELGEGEP